MTKPKKQFIQWGIIATIILGGGGGGAYVLAQNVVEKMTEKAIQKEVSKQIAPVQKDVEHIKDDVKKIEWDIMYVRVYFTQNMTDEDLEKLERKTNYLMRRGRE